MAAPMGAEYIISTAAQFWGGARSCPELCGSRASELIRVHRPPFAELEETLSLPNKASLEQMDLALKTFVYFGARYYRAPTCCRRCCCCCSSRLTSTLAPASGQTNTSVTSGSSIRLSRCCSSRASTTATRTGCLTSLWISSKLCVLDRSRHPVAAVMHARKLTVAAISP